MLVGNVSGKVTLPYLLYPLSGVGEDGLQDNAVLKDQGPVLIVLLGVFAHQHEILGQKSEE